MGTSALAAVAARGAATWAAADPCAPARCSSEAELRRTAGGEIIETVHARRGPRLPVRASLRL
jgi:hypothetical protein